MRRLAISLGLATSLLLPMTASALDTLEKIRDTHTIVIAYREAAAPFSYLDERKQPIGYSIDMCLKIADAVKRQLKLPSLKIDYVPVDATTRFTKIMDGTADMECGATTNNAERRQKVAFTIPHFFSGVKTIVHADSGIHNWPDLRGKTVATTKNTTTVHLLHERSSVRSLDVKLVEGSEDIDSFKLVEQGKADAFPMDDVLLYSLRASAKNPSKYAIVGEPLSVEPYAVMLRKDDLAFKKVVDAEVARIINDGELARMYDRWFMRPIPPKGLNLNMPMSHLLRDSMRFPSDKVGDNHPLARH